MGGVAGVVMADEGVEGLRHVGKVDVEVVARSRIVSTSTSSTGVVATRENEIDVVIR